MSGSTERDGLRCAGVTKAFDETRGVYDVSLRVPPGQVYALVGANGAGKTTLINLILGHLSPDDGTILIDGIDLLHDRGASNRLLAWVPEIARLYPQMTGLQNLLFFERLMGRDRRADEILGVLEELRFPMTAARSALGTYSKGMRQKVVIAMGLLKGATLFLLDEPTSGLDPGGMAAFARTIDQLKAAGKAILFSSHDLPSVNASADIVGVLHSGRLLLESPGGALRWRDVGKLLRDLQENAGAEDLQVDVEERSA